MKMIKVTKPGINIDYFLEHFEEILNNTDVLLTPIDSFLRWKGYDYHAEAIKRKHGANWSIFGRGDRFINPGECAWEAYRRIDREYCEATGHWDLFEWEEMTEEEYNKRVQEGLKNDKKFADNW